MSLDPRIGTVVAGCRIEERLGPGGMSLVYRAEHATLGRKVAIKFLDPRLAEDEAYRKRFLRESRLAAALYHPNIVPIYDAGEAEGVPYITMHFVQGTDLAELLKRQGSPPTDGVVTIMLQVAGALDAAHDRGLVHRDVKPANILIASGEGVEPEGHVYLTDFGLAKQVAAAGTALTKQGLFMGTLDYVAPEQIQGQEVDRRTDVYSLGCVVYECLTGTTPYPRENEVAMLYAHMQEPPPPAREHRPELPPRVDAVLARTMAKRADDRYATCRELVEDLQAALDAVPAAVPVELPPVGPSAPQEETTPPPDQRPSAPPLADVVSLDHAGTRFGLGRTANGYAIWDLEAGGRPVRLFPLADQSWAVAWQTFQDLEAAPPEEHPAASVPEAVPEPASAPVASAEPLLVGVVFLDYRGRRFALGRTEEEYAIWDLSAGGMPAHTWPIRPEAWREAWARYQEQEAAAEPAPVTPAQTAQPRELTGAVAVDYTGAGYGLGRTTDAYAIWDLSAGGSPVRIFPLHPSSWQQAWAAFQELESARSSQG
ncbi:MAG: protein kinase domain-containing protein [Actinomycetota bacterium]